MFVVVSDIKIKPGQVDDFKKWFSEANKVVSKFDGFVSRRLLETKDGQHRVLVEFESLEKFGSQDIFKTIILNIITSKMYKNTWLYISVYIYM